MRVDMVRTAPDIVCRVVDAKDLRGVDPVVLDLNGVTICFREVEVVAIEFAVQEATKEVVLELRSEVLQHIMSVSMRERYSVHTRYTGS